MQVDQPALVENDQSGGASVVPDPRHLGGQRMLRRESGDTSDSVRLLRRTNRLRSAFATESYWLGLKDHECRVARAALNKDFARLPV